MSLFRLFSASIIQISLVSICGAELVLTYKNDFTLSGTDYDKYDMVAYDGTTSSLFFDSDLILVPPNFSGNNDIEGFHRISADELWFTTRGDFELGGNDYDRGDIVLYNKTTENSSLVFDSSVLSSEKISAFSRLSTVEIAIVLEDDFSIDTADYKKGDVVRYNLTTGDNSLFFDTANITDGNEKLMHFTFLAIQNSFYPPKMISRSLE